METFLRGIKYITETLPYYIYRIPIRFWHFIPVLIVMALINSFAVSGKLKK